MDRNTVGGLLTRSEHIHPLMAKVKFQVILSVETRFREAVLVFLCCFKRLVGFLTSPIEQVTPLDEYVVL